MSAEKIKWSISQEVRFERNAKGGEDRDQFMVVFASITLGGDTYSGKCRVVDESPEGMSAAFGGAKAALKAQARDKVPEAEARLAQVRSHLAMIEAL